MDGSIITLKNAFRLANDAKILLKNGNYSSAISIATLALEEFGKHCLLEEDEETKHPRQLDSKVWHDEFENHETKLVAITRRLEKFSKIDDPDSKERLDDLKKYFIELSKTKLKALYVDWDAQNNNWYYFDDNSPDKKKVAEKAVNSVEWAIEKYIEDVGGDKDLVLTIPSMITELFRQRKIHGFCNKCSTSMITPDEYIAHHKICGAVPSWYWNENQ